MVAAQAPRLAGEAGRGGDAPAPPELRPLLGGIRAALDFGPDCRGWRFRRRFRHSPRRAHALPRASGSARIRTAHTGVAPRPTSPVPLPTTATRTSFKLPRLRIPPPLAAA